MPKINGNEIRLPATSSSPPPPPHKRRALAAVEVDHVKPGKGGAFAQVEIAQPPHRVETERAFPALRRTRSSACASSRRTSSFLLRIRDGKLVFHGCQRPTSRIELPAEILGEPPAVSCRTGNGRTRLSFYADEALKTPRCPQRRSPATVNETEPVVKGQPRGQQALSLPCSGQTGGDLVRPYMIPPFVGRRARRWVVNTRDDGVLRAWPGRRTRRQGTRPGHGRNPETARLPHPTTKVFRRPTHE